MGGGGDGGGGGTTSGCWSCWVAVGVGVGRQRGKKYPTDLDKQIEVLIVCSVCGGVLFCLCGEIKSINVYIYFVCVQNNNNDKEEECGEVAALSSVFRCCVLAVNAIAG